jgi:hypothetical protein
MSFDLRGQTISIDRRRLPSGQMIWFLGLRSDTPPDCFGVATVIRFSSASHLVTRISCSVLVKICLKLSRLMVRDASDTDVARDVAEKFGLIYAGGALGIQCGLLPWKKRANCWTQ